MGLDNRSVDENIFEVCFVIQGIEKALEYACFCPAVKPLEHRIPLTKLSGQVTPRCPCADPPKYRFHETPIIAARRARVASLPGRSGAIFFQRSSEITKRSWSIQPPFGKLESEFYSYGNSECQQTLVFKISKKNFW